MSEPIVETVQLSKTYGYGLRRARSYEALKNLTLKVEVGQVFAFLGPNGAGKSTTVNLLMGFLRPTSGLVRLFGRPPDEHLIRGRIGFVPEDYAFYRFLTGAGVLNKLGGLFGIPARRRSQKVEHLLTTFGLWDARNVKVGKYSRGMTQRLGMAQALLNDPRLLILDEPTSGFDVLARKQLLDQFVRWKSEGMSIFLSSHILSEVEAVSDCVAILHQGNLIREGTLKEILRSDQGYIIAFLASTDQILNKLTKLDLRVERTGTEMRACSRSQEVSQVAMDMIRAEGGTILSFEPVRKTLEGVFAEIFEDHPA